MSKRTGLISQITKFIRHFDKRAKPLEVGKDHLGNKYFIQEADLKKNRRGSRFVEPPNNDKSAVPEVPLEWDAWLRYKRDSPPIQEEIDRNMAVSERTLRRARDIEEKDNLEREYPSQGTQTSAITSTVTSKSEQRKFPKRPGLELTPGSGTKER